jgi:hypothetical protein
MDIAVKVLTPFFVPPQAIVIGGGERPDALSAAFLNAVSANVLECYDRHLATVMHSTAGCASAQDKRLRRPAPRGRQRDRYEVNSGTRARPQK